jgi:hypothetical protein
MAGHKKEGGETVKAAALVKQHCAASGHSGRRGDGNCIEHPGNGRFGQQEALALRG